MTAARLLCDVHLEWARMHLAAGGVDATGGHLERARVLAAETGYRRREGELASLASAVG